MADAEAGDAGDAGDEAGQIDAEAAVQQLRLNEKEEERRHGNRSSPPRPKPSSPGGRLSPIPPSSHNKSRAVPRHRRGASYPVAMEQLIHPLGPSEGTTQRSLPDSHGHQRNISWDMGVPSAAESHPPSVEGGARHRRVPTKISLRQVLRHSPFETEADAYLQAALEDADAATSAEGRPANVQASILGHVPLDVTAQSFRVDAADSFTADGQQPARNNRRPMELPLAQGARRQRKAMSTAESLYQLTMDLEQLKSLDESAATAETPKATNANAQGFDAYDNETQDGEGDDASSPEKNSLLKNAAIIMRNEVSSFRRQALDGLESTQRAARTSVPARGGLEMTDSERWNPLQRVSRRKQTSEQEIVFEHEEVENRDDVEGGETSANITGDSTKVTSTNNLIGGAVKTCKKQAATEYKDFEDWLRYKRSSMWTHIKVVLFFIMLPATGIAAILFYLAGNPPCGYDRCTGSSPILYIFDPFHQASASWWVLFVCCRQAITFSFARATNSVVVDYLALRTRWFVRAFGPFITLFIVQSSGWPFTLFFWGVYDFILLYGGSEFANHWMFYQNAIHMFNNENPSGGITEMGWYRTLLVLSVVVSFVVAVKRFYLGLVQGKQTYIRYGEELARIMKRALLINQVGRLARDIEMSQLRFDNFDFKVASFDSGDDTSLDGDQAQPADFTGFHLLSGVARGSKKARLNELLGAWEEPETQETEHDNPDIGAIIQFRQSLSYLNSPVPFGLAFGPSSTRQECVESAETVYHRLLLSIPDEAVLSFDVLAMLAIDRKGKLDDEKVRDLINLYRPDREGALTVLDFAKTVDTVYKEIKLLRANVMNSSKLDKAFEKILNIVFYFVLFIISVAALGVDPFLLLGSISTFIIGFAFMIAAACSHYVEGLLLILVRRPYEIGDRIHIGDPNQDTASTGSPGWIVKDIDLFTTTVVLGATNEVATYANGSLAASRIINSARSHKAVLSFVLKFPIDTPYSKLQIFKAAMERFVKARPREWGNFFAFRCTRIEADLGFVEYIVLGQHREAWQKIGAVLQSRADLSSFALELSKKMGMRYVSPPMPVDLRVKGGELSAAELEEASLQQQRGGVGSAPHDQDHNEDGSVVGQVAQDVAAMFDTHLSPH